MIYLRDDFFFANGTAWDPRYWTTSSAGSTGTQDIQSNKGRLLTGATINSVSRAVSSASVPAKLNMEILVKVTLQNPLVNQNVLIAVRGDGVWATTPKPNNAYLVELNVNSNNFNVSKVIGGTRTDFTTTSFTFVAGTDVWVRLHAVFDFIAANVWADGTNEPTDWSFSTSDNAYMTPGIVMLRNFNGTAAAMTSSFASLAVDDLQGSPVSQLLLGT